MRVPGAYIMFVASHADAADKAAVDEQCLLVQHFVESRLQHHEESLKRASMLHAIPLPRLYNKGEILRVSVKEGWGVSALRTAVIRFAMDANFYGEPILPSALKLKERLSQVRAAACHLAKEYHKRKRTNASARAHTHAFVGAWLQALATFCSALPRIVTRSWESHMRTNAVPFHSLMIAGYTVAAAARKRNPA